MIADREIADLLAVRPSPEFVARVRQHVAGEPSPRRRLPASTVAAGCAALASVVALSLWRVPHETNAALAAPTPLPAAALARATESAKLPDTSAPGVTPTAAPAMSPPAPPTEFVPVPEMVYRAIEPQRGLRPVAEMEVHAVPSIEPAGGERPWSTL